MKQRNRIKLFVACLAILFGLAGCSPNATESQDAIPAHLARYQAELEKARESSSDPTTEKAGLETLAKLLHSNGSQTEAMKAYRRLIVIDPTNPRWPHSLAYLLAGYGKLDEAIPFQESAAKLALSEVAPKLRLAEMLIKRNQPEDATALYQQVLELDPDNKYALLGLARCELERGDIQSAQDKLERSVEIDPQFTGGWALLSTVFEKRGLHESAKEARIKSFGRYVDFPDPWLGDLWEFCYDPYQLSVAAAVTTDSAESRKLLERAIELAPSSSSYHRQLGNLLQKQGDLASSQAQYEKAVEADRYDSESWAALVNVLMNRQDYKRLSATLEEALALCPESAYLHYANGRRFAMIGLYDNAVQEFSEAKRIQPHEGRSYVQLAMIHLMKGDIEKAKSEVEVARKKEPSNPDIYVLLAKTSIMAGNRIEAKKWYQALAEIPNHSKEDLQILRQDYEHAFRQKL